MVDRVNKRPDKGDPSEILQLFPSYNLQVLCCRYWWLRKWEFAELSFPYWRIYWNKSSGAVIYYNGQEYELKPDRIFVIAPNTPYATKLFRSEFPDDDYELEGARIASEEDENEGLKHSLVQHLFIHFTIGFPYDFVAPGVFEIYLDDHLRPKVLEIIKHLKIDSASFDFSSTLIIQSLISELLSKIPDSNWKGASMDFRVLDAFRIIESNLSDELTNTSLAKMVNLSTNAFARLFRNEVGISPQKYVKEKRINRACMLLHHSPKTIDEVASLTGFANRYHFSREFKLQVGLSPADYKKKLIK